MNFERFQDFLTGLVNGQRGLFSKAEAASIDELLEKLMGTVGEVSAIVTARQVLDHYAELSVDEKLEFFKNLEQNYNANDAMVRIAFEKYDQDPSSANLSALSKSAEPLRLELFRRLNQTPGATHDLVAMRTHLLSFLKTNPELAVVDSDFVRLFTSWFGRGFLQLQTINWSTSAAILERIIRYEAVHEIKDWDDLRSRIDPPNRRCFAFFHPALVDEPLIFVEVALTKELPGSISAILEEGSTDPEETTNYKTAVFYSISNCQPGLRSISFGNFLIKQVVQELQAEFPAIKTFVTLSPVPGFGRWLEKEADPNQEGVLDELHSMKAELLSANTNAESLIAQTDLIKKLVFNYLATAKRGKFPADPVARFHLGNGASLHQIHIGADMSEKGVGQSRSAMVDYLYDLNSIEVNHENFATEGHVDFNDKLKSLLIKA